MDPIPWYKSPVFVSLLVAFVTKGAALLGIADKIAAVDLAGTINQVLDLVALAAIGVAGYKRAHNSTQNLTLTKAGADNASTTKCHPATIALLLLATSLLAGCPATMAVKEAQTVEQRAAALIGDYSIAQSAAIKIGTDETVPAVVRAQVVDGVRAAKPAVEQLEVALRTYREIDATLEPAATKDEKIRIAAANLSSWILKVAPQIQSLRKQIDGVIRHD